MDTRSALVRDQLFERDERAGRPVEPDGASGRAYSRCEKELDDDAVSIITISVILLPGRFVGGIKKKGDKS